MAPVSPVGQGGLSYRRPAQHPGVWQFADIVEESTTAPSAAPQVPAASLPRISLQVQEMLSQPDDVDAMTAFIPGQQRRRAADDEDRPVGDRRVGDRRARRRSSEMARA